MHSCSALVVLLTALAGCQSATCRPSPTLGDPPTEDAMTDFAPLPPPPDVPAVAQIAVAVAAGVPALERPRATDLLSKQIVPWQLRGLATFPQPRRLAEVVYEELVDELRPVPEDRRLATIETIACRVTGERILGDAMGLAIRRWSLDHGGRPPPTPWIDLAAPWAGKDLAALALESDRRRVEIDQLAASTTGDCRETLRLSLMHARLALGAATTGSFTTAVGAMVDFLHAVGEAPQVLDVH